MGRNLCTNLVLDVQNTWGHLQPLCAEDGDVEAGRTQFYAKNYLFGAGY